MYSIKKLFSASWLLRSKSVTRIQCLETTEKIFSFKKRIKERLSNKFSQKILAIFNEQLLKARQNRKPLRLNFSLSPRLRSISPSRQNDLDPGPSCHHGKMTRSADPSCLQGETTTRPIHLAVRARRPHPLVHLAIPARQPRPRSV